MPSTRSWPIPDSSRSIHALGDLHYGATSADRLAKLKADLDKLPPPTLYVHMGDLIQDSPLINPFAKAWLDSLNAPWLTATGNHDIFNGNQTPEEFATAMGMPGKNFTEELDFQILVFVNPDSLGEDNVRITLSAGTLTWLDDQLAAADKDCTIICHAPLKDTVLGDTATNYTSRAADLFYAEPDTEIRDILDARPRAKAWLSGHTHSAMTMPDLVKSESVGSRSLAAINCSAPYFVGKTAEWYDPIASLRLTYTEDAIEVRHRNHGAGVWDTIGGVRVTEVAA